MHNKELKLADVSITLRSVFWTKDAYRQVAADFYPCHSRQMNLILHWIGAGVQMWGAVQLLSILNLQIIVYAFVAYVGVTTPVMTALAHTALFYGFLTTSIPIESMLHADVNIHPIVGCLVAFTCGFLKDVGHHVCDEPAFMGSYMKERPHMFFFHATWHLPFLIDAYSPFSTVQKTKEL